MIQSKRRGNARISAAGGRRGGPWPVAAVVVAASLLSWSHDAVAQSKPRINPLIEALAAGGNALTPTEWTFIDMEHGPYLLDQLQATLIEMNKNRKPSGQLASAPIVRIPMDGDEDSHFAVKQVLDSGALGIVFPHIESKEQALKAVRSMRYPPQRGTQYPAPAGLRGYGPGRAAKFWGVPVEEYIQRADVWPLNPNGELLAVMMIESAEGVKRADEIMNTPGVGAIFIGASDLGMSLGVGPASPKVPPETEAATQTILKACKAHKLICAYPAVNGEVEVKKRLNEGFRMLLVTGRRPTE